MKPEMVRDDAEVFRWKTNRAVVPPVWLENAGIPFDRVSQQFSFDAMAARFADQYDPSNETLVSFVDFALGNLILRPTIGEHGLATFIKNARTGWRKN